MKKFFAKQDGDFFVFEDEEFAHFNVVRCKLGEQVLCFGENNTDYICEVTQVNKKQAKAKIVKAIQNTKNPKINITLYQGMVKGEKADLIVQKLTELGASNLYFFESEFTIAKGNNNKIDRLQKISREACKQCGRSVPLNIFEIKFNELIQQLNNYDLILFANEKDTFRSIDNLKEYKNIAIIVGSEGGFSDNEIVAINSKGAVNFGLGSRILRAETAAIATTAIVGYLLDV